MTLHNGHFINGGLIILKRHVAEVLNFNSLLLHNEAEDVELSFMLRSHGIVPRINPHSSAVAIGIPDSYTGTFLCSVTAPPSPPSPFRLSISRVAHACWRRLPFVIKQVIRKPRIYDVLKRYLRTH
jgi:hypothetical protein